MGIGSAAIVAALALRLQGQEEAAPLSSCAAVPFFQPHQLVIIAIGRVSWVELGRKRLAARQPLCGRVGEVPIGVVQELARPPYPCPGTSVARTCRGSGRSDQYSNASGRRATPSNPPARPIRPRRPSCSAKPRSTAFCDGGCARLVIDDREPAVGQPVDPVDAALDHDSRQRRLAFDFGRQGPPARRLVLALHSRDPVDRFEQPRRPQRAQHRVNGFVSQAAARPAPAACQDRSRPAAAIPRTPCGRRSPFHRAVWSASTGSSARSLRIACA